MKVGFTAVADPSSYRQHELDPGLVTLLDEIYIVRPAIIPPLSHLSDSHATGAICREGSQLEFVSVEDRWADCSHDAVLLRSRSLYVEDANILNLKL